MAGTGGLMGAMGLLSSASSSDIGDVEMSPSRLGHGGASSVPIVIAADAAAGVWPGAKNDVFSLPKGWCCSTASVGPH